MKLSATIIAENDWKFIKLNFFRFDFGKIQT